MNEFSFELIRDVAPQPIVLEPLHTEENGVFAPPAGVNGFSQVEVAVPIPPAPVLTSLSVSENGTYTPEQGVDGFIEVEVVVPATKITYTGDIHDAFKNADVWNAVKDHCEFDNITRIDGAWYANNGIDYLPPINISTTSGFGFQSTFDYSSLRSTPQFICQTASGTMSVNKLSFYFCTELETADLTGLEPDSNQKLDFFFNNCYHLRSYDTDFVSQIEAGGSDDTYGGFGDCHSLDEIKGYPYIKTGSSFLRGCYRLKAFTYKDFGAAQQIGNKTIRLDGKFYVSSRETFLDTTSFTDATEITDAATYALLKNNPDQWSADIAYSRYNHTAAAETINSLPTNTYLSPVIQFTGNSGSGTDGGAISDLTPEEIAVATTKGWTISFV